MSNFVTKSGTQLMLNGQVFRYAGLNAFDLGYTFGASAWDVVDTFRTMQEMGLTVCRIHALSMSHSASNPNTSSLEGPNVGQYNNNVWLIRDHVLQQANIYGIKLVLPLVNHWPAYGPKKFYTDYFSIPEANFYSDTNCITAFENYINFFITHVNTITGVMYRDDPAILCWETGNELDSTVAWVNTICAYIRSIDSNHLIMDGTDQSLNGPAVTSTADIISPHYYGTNAANLTTVLASDTNLAIAAGKVMTVGEWDWIQVPTEQQVSAFLDAMVADTRVSGNMFWAFFSRGDTDGWRGHQPAYTNTSGSFDVRYPGETSDLAARIAMLRSHAYQMQGLSVPAHNTPSAPILTSVNSSGAHNTITWRGTDASSTYGLERLNPTTYKWEVIANQTVTDSTPPYTDLGLPSGNYRYRIRGYNLDGNPGPYSAIVSPSAVDSMLGLDSFNNRQLVETWDYSTDGQTWTSIGSTGNIVHLSVLNNSGGISAQSGQTPVVIMKLGSHTGTDMEGYVRWSPGATADTVNIFLRLVDSTHYYSLGNIGTTLTIGKKTGGSFVSLASTTVVAPVPGAQYWFHFKVAGTTLSGKMWPDLFPEETSAWMVTATDSSIASGGIGLGANPTTTTPATFDHYLTIPPQNAPPAAFVRTKVRH